MSNGFNFQAPYQPVLYAFIADDGHVWFDFKSKNDPYAAGICRVDTNGEGNACSSAVSVVTQTGLLNDGSIFAVWDHTPPAFLNPDGSPQANAGYVPNGEVRQEWRNGNFGVPRDCHPPAFGSDRTRYVGCKDGFMVMKPSGSDTIWSFPTPGHWASQPAVAQDGTVYFGSDDGHYMRLTRTGR